MSTLFSSLRHLSFNQIFSAYFDATERRLVARSIVIGALVWSVVLEYYAALALLAILISQIGVYFSWLRVRTSYFFRSGRFNDVQRNLTGFVLAGLVHHHLALNPSVGRPLQQGDTLLLLGEDQVLDQFEINMVAEISAAPAVPNHRSYADH